MFNNSNSKTAQVLSNFSTKLMLTTAQSSMTTQHLHSFNFTMVNEDVTALSSCYSLHRMPFSNFVGVHSPDKGFSHDNEHMHGGYIAITRQTMCQQLYTLGGCQGRKMP